MSTASTLIIAFGALALTAAATAAFIAARRFASADRQGPLPLEELMRRRGALLPQPLTKADAREAALAARRCLSCNSKALCRELLRANGCQGYGLFCPNTHYIERLRRDTLTFR
jgi:hypothetical protein